MNFMLRSDSSTSVEISNIDGDNNWSVAVEEGNIERLYKLIQDDPKVLDNIDAIPFVQTPLHDAATTQHLQFAAEIMRLKPSFATKPNLEGWCPIHLALLQGNEKMVDRFVDMKKELVGAEGREGLTPLHLAAQLGKVELIDKFLKAWPNSIEKVTVRNETALHIALEFQQFKSFEGMVIRLKKNANKGASRLEKTVLNWKDDAGNTVLHLSAKKGLFKIVESLIERKVDLNATNVEKNTALDLACSEEVKKILARCRALSGVAIKEASGDQINSKILERWLIGKTRIRGDITEDRLNAFLVVATLVATATYQTAMTPPGGLYSAEANNTTNNTTKLNHLGFNSHANWTPNTHEIAGNAIMPSFNFIMFSSANMISFLTSTYVIFGMLPRGPVRGLLFVPTFLLQMSYILSVLVVSPSLPAATFIGLCYLVLELIFIHYVFLIDFPDKFDYL